MAEKLRMSASNVLVLIGLVLSIVLPITNSVNQFKGEIAVLTSEVTTLTKMVEENKVYYIKVSDEMREVAKDIVELEKRIFLLERKREWD